MRIRGGLVTLIYRKSLVLSNGEKTGRATGDIVNLQSVDAVRIADLAQYGHIAWSGPFQVGQLPRLPIFAHRSDPARVHITLPASRLAAIMGVAVMVISVSATTASVAYRQLPINTFIAKYNKTLQRQLMKTKDTRTRVMSDILNNIKSIKLYGWEQAFAAKVFDARNNNELRQLRKIGIVQAASSFLWTSTPFLVAFATFATFVLSSCRPLTSEIIFPAISLIQLLSYPMAMFSNIISSIIEANVSVARLEEFLAADELDKTARTVISPAEDPQGNAEVGDSVVIIKGGEFRWIRKSKEPILQDINLEVSKGELLAVVGRVGDGKSSLLSALLGEMTRSRGSVTIRGDIAYFSQTSWILSATVKDNIVFGHRFDPVFYNKVLDSCALKPDLAVLPHGHMTEVGEKGVSLSGGQKARISLARACYARADVYLLDDPLSAVDAHVGRHIFDEVIGPKGILKHKARILCTNAMNFLPNTDQIIMLRHGIILERGTYDEAIVDSSSELHTLITGLGKQSAKTSDYSVRASTSIFRGLNSEKDDPEIMDKSNVRRHRKMMGRPSAATMRRASSTSIRQAKRDALRDLRENAWSKEHTEKGGVNRTIYMNFINSASPLGLLIVLLAMSLGQGSSIVANYVLRFWAQVNSSTGESSQIGTYLVLYGVIGLSSTFLGVACNAILRLYCGMRSSQKLHDDSFAALMRSPLSFFELTPSGRILNLFSRDIFVIDEVLVQALGSFFRTVSPLARFIPSLTPRRSRCSGWWSSLASAPHSC